jgi:hypothetical protein
VRIDAKTLSRGVESRSTVEVSCHVWGIHATSQDVQLP